VRRLFIIPDIPSAPTPPSRLLWIPLLWWIVVHAGTLAAPFTFTWSGLVVAAVLYLLTGIGITMGYHRLLTHRSFQTPRWVEYLLTLFASFATQGGPLHWVSIHRVHHQHSDKDEDPHTPRHGFCWAHMFWWMFSGPTMANSERHAHYIPDLARNPVHRFFENFHFLFTLILAGLLYAGGEWWGGVGLSWLVWGLFVRITVLYHATYFVNSAAHLWGYRSHATSDGSRNSWWVALLTLGEGWHNNHHAFPRSARHGLRWWELDVTYLLIRLMSFLALARHIHVPGKVLRPVRSRTHPE
jgi:fatty-acid desaturase